MRLLIPFLTATALACAGTADGVDIAWKVLPRRVTADNFGSRVAKLYYAVAAVVGNDSGYDIQVSSIFFQLPAAAGLSAPVPADPYRIVRGTLEREHQFGFRSTTVGIIKALGPVLAGGTAFIPGPSYARVVDLFVNPFEKGVEAVFPDKTVSQLAALDSVSLRDIAVIGNNSQKVLMVFVSRDLLLNPETGKRFPNEFNPPAVMRSLGDLVLAGKSIAYVNRITVSTKPGINGSAAGIR